MELIDRDKVRENVVNFLAGVEDLKPGVLTKP